MIKSKGKNRFNNQPKITPVKPNSTGSMATINKMKETLTYNITRRIEIFISTFKTITRNKRRKTKRHMIRRHEGTKKTTSLFLKIFRNLSVFYVSQTYFPEPEKITFS